LLITLHDSVGTTRDTVEVVQCSLSSMKNMLICTFLNQCST